MGCEVNRVKNIPEREHAALLGACLNGSYKRLAIALIASSGARANEILRLKSTNIVVQPNEFRDSTNPIDSTNPVESVKIFIEASKGSRNRVVPLTGELLARAKSLKSRLSERESLTLAALVNSGSWSVSSAYELIRREFNELQVGLWGCQRYTLHSLRHTIAIKALTRGLDIVKVKTLLGHKSINTTMVYLREYEDTLTLDELPSLVPNGVKQ